MKNFDRFDTPLYRERATRVFRAARIVGSRAVREAAKANPAILWMDCAYALLDAANAYFEFAAENERLKALRLVTARLDAELENLKRAEARSAELACREAARMQADLDFSLTEVAAEHRTRMLEREATDRIILMMREALDKLRDSADRDLPQLENLQNEFDAFLRATIDIRLAAFTVRNN